MSGFNMPPGVSERDIPGQDDPLVVTERINPPIPTTMFDWMATTAYGDENGPIGRGPTEASALQDLCEQLTLILFDRPSHVDALQTAAYAAGRKDEREDWERRAK